MNRNPNSRDVRHGRFHSAFKYVGGGSPHLEVLCEFWLDFYVLGLKLTAFSPGITA